MTEQLIHRSGNSVILYDASALSQITPAMFRAEHWPQATVVPGYSGGRGATLFVTHEEQEWVVKHYHRGGLVGRVLSDQFVYTGQFRVRSVAEWNVLQLAAAEGLPVPQPVAAHYERRGPIYSADLITRRIPNVEPFSSRIGRAPVASSIWEAVGACIRRFHDAGFYHADLSTHNLQIAADDAIWLLDWDRGERRAPGSWRQANLSRLQRSCYKVQSADGAHFTANDWQALMAGYKSA